MRLQVYRFMFAFVVLSCACSNSERKNSVAPSVSSSSTVTAAPAMCCPSEMARVNGYCIDRWEAHLVDRAGKRLPGNARPRDKTGYEARSAAGVKPQGYINRFEAALACKRAGKRLCEARQWLDACRGAKRSRYPYGTERIDGRCNTHKLHLPVKVFGHKTRLTYGAHYNNPRLHDEPGFLSVTGQYEGCRSDYGVYDMVGNLHEWVADDVTNSLSERIPLSYGKHMMGRRGNGVFMGGYFSSRGEHGKGCVYTTTNHAPDYHDYSIGFRCCRDVEPCK